MKISDHALTRTHNRVGHIKPRELWKASRAADRRDLARFTVNAEPNSEYRICCWHGSLYLLIRDIAKDILVTVIRLDMP